jgi:hypothetical protein
VFGAAVSLTLAKLCIDLARLAQRREPSRG